MLDEVFFYDGPLGTEVGPEGVSIRLWAPTACEVSFQGLVSWEKMFLRPQPLYNSVIPRKRLHTEGCSQTEWSLMQFTASDRSRGSGGCEK